MKTHTFAKVNLVASLDWVLGEVPVCEALEVHESNLGASNLDIRECINDVRDQACGYEQLAKQHASSCTYWELSLA